MMSRPTVELSTFRNTWFDRGASRWKELCWLVVSAAFFRHPLSLWNGAKIWWLRRFGAKVGNGVLIKPQVQIKFPWKLGIGDHSWIGENAWIDNLAPVDIGSNVCISQGSYLFAGNHDYKKTTFDLIVKPIVIKDGAWLGAKTIVCPGVTVGSHAVLATGSVATSDLEEYGIYQGNPAAKVRQRIIQ